MKSANPPLKSIEEAAVDIFGEMGLEGATARKVAARFKGAAGSIYYYFKSMVDMYARVMGSRFESAWQTLWQPLLQADDRQSLEGAMESWNSRLTSLDKGQRAALKASFVEILGIGRDNPFRHQVTQTRQNTLKELASLVTSTHPGLSASQSETQVMALWSWADETLLQHLSGLQIQAPARIQKPDAQVEVSAKPNVKVKTEQAEMPPVNPRRKLSEELL